MRIQKEFVVESSDYGEMIAESFGITGGYIQKIADIDIPTDWSILYITGESGVGKTTILNEIKKKMGGGYIEIPEKNKIIPLFLVGGEDEESQINTINALTRVGLSDAVLWMNTYTELSDSQKARFEIAWGMIHSDILFVDEFLSTLDRESAKPVAYSIQKAIREKGKRMVVATAHSDIVDYLQPDYTITGQAFPSRWELKKNNYSGENKIVSELEIVYGTKEDYKKARLGELHYKGKYTGGTKEYLFAYLNERMVGLLVSIYNMHTGGRRIARVVVHPSYRGCGVGKAIVSRYIHDFPRTDVVASMALYNPIFDSAGMVRVNDVEIHSPSGLKKSLCSLGFDVSKWCDKQYLYSFCENESVRNVISDYSSKATSLVCPAGKYLKDDEIKQKIQTEVFTASRVLFGLRDRKMAKYEVGHE